MIEGIGGNLGGILEANLAVGKTWWLQVRSAKDVLDDADVTCQATQLCPL
jgi:hypothetical protein